MASPARAPPRGGISGTRGHDGTRYRAAALAVQAAWENAPKGCAERPAKLLSAVELQLTADASAVQEVPA